MINYRHQYFSDGFLRIYFTNQWEANEKALFLAYAARLIETQEFSIDGKTILPGQYSYAPTPDWLQDSV